MGVDDYLLSSYDFDVPPDLIAQTPLDTRTDSRLMRVDRRTGEISHYFFSDLPELLLPTDHLVLNNTKVIKARLKGVRPSGALVEIFVDRILSPDRLSVLLTPAKRIRIGDYIRLSETEGMLVLERSQTGPVFTVSWEGRSTIWEAIDRLGSVPLPPYLKAAGEANQWETRYQTVYAKRPGAVAAPTAGLHFDGTLFDRLAAQGIGTSDVTLHVGWGTFQPIRSVDIRQHRMHPEWYNMPERTSTRLDKVRQTGRVIAVGTTAARTLETVFDHAGYQPGSGMTTMFIYPGVPVKGFDGLITNFHLPNSSLFLLVSAFSSHPLMKKAYQEAIRERYRFYSFGDAMLIL
ncbi:MAG: tRNA preQ1(34) S-adenosylmethionine ribosyltransferase-isomerase QueA [Candidatus Margulisiibacteriota bacterium]